MELLVCYMEESNGHPYRNIVVEVECTADNNVEMKQNKMWNNVRESRESREIVDNNPLVGYPRDFDRYLYLQSLV